MDGLIGMDMLNWLLIMGGRIGGLIKDWGVEGGDEWEERGWEGENGENGVKLKKEGKVGGLERTRRE